MLFGLGLTVSQMINPAKVIAFLDLFGAWDPSLAFVMAGAIPVAALGYRLAGRRETPVCATDFVAPASTAITGSGREAPCPRVIVPRAGGSFTSNAFKVVEDWTIRPMIAFTSLGEGLYGIAHADQSGESWHRSRAHDQARDASHRRWPAPCCAEDRA
jgi:hypothetical protein